MTEKRLNRRRSNASICIQISPTPGPWPSSSSPYLTFLPKVAQKKHHRASELLGRWGPFFRRFREKRLRNG